MKKVFLILTSVVLFSCDNFMEVNEEQSNNPSADILTPNNMLAGAMNNFTSNQVISFNNFGNEMSYVWALNNGFTSSNPNTTYDFASSSNTGLFDTTYLFADNFQDILDKQAEKPEYAHHYAIAKLFKVMSMDLLVTLYGDVPYTEAFNSAITKPKYDDDATIIPKLFLELDQARSLITSTDPSIVPLGAEDIVCKGDVAKWLKFINTVELRMLLRLSKTTNANLIALRNARFATLPNNFITSDVTNNPGYGMATLGDRNPIFRTWGRNVAFDDWSNAWKANAAGSFCAKLLLGQLNTPDIVNTGFVDPRRPRIFNGTTYTNQGSTPVVDVARFATFFHGRTGSAVDPANKAASERNAFIMLAAESYFLQAEAVQRGYMAGSAQALFDQGIQASFAFYNDYSFTDLPNGTLNPATYITASSTRLGLGWAATPDKLNCIMNQKYIALAQWNGFELFIDNLRTGYPALPLPDGVTRPNRPNRQIYPSSEYSTNSTNVPNVTVDEIFSVNAKTPVYLQ
jgi:hypothetical protein